MFYLFIYLFIFVFILQKADSSLKDGLPLENTDIIIHVFWKFLST